MHLNTPIERRAQSLWEVWGFRGNNKEIYHQQPPVITVIIIIVITN